MPHSFGRIGLAVMGQNLVQAQRDFFGAHTFERLDREGVLPADRGDG